MLRRGSRQPDQRPAGPECHIDVWESARTLTLGETVLAETVELLQADFSENPKAYGRAVAINDLAVAKAEEWVAPPGLATSQCRPLRHPPMGVRYGMEVEYGMLYSKVTGHALRLLGFTAQ